MQKILDRLDRMDAGFQRLEGRLDTSIQQLESKLDTSIQRLESKLDTSIQRLESKLDTSIQQLESKLDTSIQRLESKLNTGLQRLEDKMDAGFQKQGGQLEALQDGVKLALEGISATERFWMTSSPRCWKSSGEAEKAVARLGPWAVITIGANAPVPRSPSRAPRCCAVGPSAVSPAQSCRAD